MAKLHFKYGAMNSGKTDILIKTAYNYIECGLKVIVIKPAKDTKGDKFIVSRAGFKRAVDILAEPKTNIYSEINKIIKDNQINCVLVDEAQFLSSKQINQLFKIAKVKNISVICYGLRADFRTKLFSGSKRLFEIADNIEKLPTMCYCGSQAEFNCRKVNGKYVFHGNQIAIDKKDSVTYDSLCGKCYQKEKSKSS